MAYTTIDDPTIFFTTNLRSGLYGGSDTAFNIGFQPDWIWNKKRSGSGVHSLFDVVRGFGASGKVIYSNTTGAEATNALIKSVSSTGFTVTASSDDTGTMVDWCWKAGGSASSNSNGSITSSVSANTTAGFSIVSYTGTASAGATVGHGLGVKPDMIITKARAIEDNWGVYHKSLGATKGLYLNTTNAEITSSAYYNNTEPTSTLVTLGDNEATNDNDTMIMYAFAEKQGYSKFGSFVSNGNADGAFCYLGFRAAWILMKKSSGSGTDWYIFYNKSPGYNENNKSLRPNENHSETQASGYAMDILSNGFKIRTSNTAIGESGATFVYAAFAESPFVTSTGVPNNAR